MSQVRLAFRAEPVVQDFAFKLGKRLYEESHVVVYVGVSPIGKRFEDDVLPALGDDGLPERLVDGVLDRFAIEITFLRDETQVLVITYLPIDGSADFVKVELPAEHGMPRRDVVLALEVAIERLARDVGVLADLRNGYAVERFVYRMKNLEFRLDFRGVKNAPPPRKIPES